MERWIPIYAYSFEWSTLDVKLESCAVCHVAGALAACCKAAASQVVHAQEEEKGDGGSTMGHGPASHSKQRRHGPVVDALQLGQGLGLGTN